MDDRVIIDTDILIDFLRGKQDAVNIIKKLSVQKFLGTTDINAFELYHGAYKSKNQERNLASVKGLLNSLFLVGTSEDSMEMAAKIITTLERRGKKIDIRDLFIASICLVNSFSFLTKNKKHFEGVEGLIFSGLNENP